MCNKNNTIDVNSLASLATIILISSIVPIVLLAAPALVGVFVSSMGLTPQHGGYLISSEMAGMGLATLPALFWVKAVNWQRVALIALLVAGLGQIATVVVDSLTLLLVIRFVTGLAGGTVMSVCLAAINLTANPDRIFGLWVVGQLTFGAIVIAVLPSIVASFGIAGFYLPLAVVLALLVLVVKHLPTHTPSTVVKRCVQATSQVVTLVRVTMGIIGLFIFYCGLSGAWTYIERLGDNAGLEVSMISNALVIASLAGIAGALAASVLGAKWGRLIPAGSGVVLMVTALTLLAGTGSFVAVTPAIFLLAACLFKFTWTFVLPYLLSLISDNDATGRIIVVANFVIGGGLAAGPALSAMILTADNYAAIMWVAALFMVICLLLYLPLLLYKPE